MKSFTATCSCVLALALGGGCASGETTEPWLPAARTSEEIMLPEPPEGCRSKSELGGWYSGGSLAALDGVTAIRGNLTLSGDVTDLSALRCLVRIDGNLIVSETELQSLDALSNLAFVGGHLSLRGNAALEDIDALASLEVVGGGFSLTDSPRLARVLLPGLDALGHSDYLGPSYFGSLYLARLPALRSVELPYLRAMTSSLTVVHSGEAAERALRLELSSLQKIGGALKLDALPQLSSLDGFRWLRRVEGPLVLSELPELQSLNGLDRLEIVNGFVSIREDARLQNLDALSMLRQVDHGLSVSRSPLLQSIRLPNLTSLGDFAEVGAPFYGSLNLYNLGSLEKVELHKLETTTNDVILRKNGWGGAGSLQLDFSALSSVGGALRLEDMCTLESLAAFDAIAALAGGLSVLNNACLDDNEAMALSARLASKTQAIMGNGQGCTLH